MKQCRSWLGRHRQKRFDCLTIYPRKLPLILALFYEVRRGVGSNVNVPNPLKRAQTTCVSPVLILFQQIEGGFNYLQSLFRTSGIAKVIPMAVLHVRHWTQLGSMARSGPCLFQARLALSNVQGKILFLKKIAKSHTLTELRVWSPIGRAEE